MKPAFSITAEENINLSEYLETRIHYFWFAILNKTVRQKISIAVSGDVFSKMSLGLVGTLSRNGFGSFIGNNTIGWIIYEKVSNETSF